MLRWKLKWVFVRQISRLNSERYLGGPPGPPPHLQTGNEGCIRQRLILLLTSSVLRRSLCYKKTYLFTTPTHNNLGFMNVSPDWTVLTPAALEVGKLVYSKSRQLKRLKFSDRLTDESRTTPENVTLLLSTSYREGIIPLDVKSPSFPTPAP